jgi:hypothetical protein
VRWLRRADAAGRGKVFTHVFPPHHPPEGSEPPPCQRSVARRRSHSNRSSSRRFQPRLEDFPRFVSVWAGEWIGVRALPWQRRNDLTAAHHRPCASGSLV